MIAYNDIDFNIFRFDFSVNLYKLVSNLLLNDAMKIDWTQNIFDFITSYIVFSQ